jgi:hypothetical protein
MAYIIGVDNLRRIKLTMLTKKSKLFGILTTAIMITLVVGLVAASSQMNPRVTYSGYGNPDNDTGREGDLYVEIDTNVLWMFKDGAWDMFAIFPTVINGTDGPIGPTGPAGPQGETGETGPTGPAGADGEDGTQMYNELMYNCTDSLGNNGDFFIFANGTLNVKIDGSWMFYGSLVGPQGEQGIQGEIGPTGPAGPQGETGETGPMGPQGEIGPTGPAGPQGETGETGPMGPQGEIGPTGPAGADGIDGLNGIDGKDGLDGLQGINETEGTIELEMPWWIIVLFAVVSGLALAISVYALRKNRRK